MEAFILKSIHKNLNLAFQIANLKEKQIKNDLCCTFFSKKETSFLL